MWNGEGNELSNYNINNYYDIINNNWVFSHTNISYLTSYLKIIMNFTTKNNY